MSEHQHGFAIELEAARMAVAWKTLFAEELLKEARRIAQEAELITTEHYRQALPEALSKVLHAIESGSPESISTEQRVA